MILPKKKKRPKYNNVKVVIDGIEFDSKKEGNRYNELKLLVMGREIKDLKLQPRFDLMVNGAKIGFYKGDFYYYDIKNKKYVVEDVKSKATATPVYRIKKKILATYDPPITIIEV